MAYHSTQGVASGRLDLLNTIKDFLVTTVGWTLHDDQSAFERPYYIFLSRGESGAEDIYLLFRISQTAHQLNVSAYQYWDNITHTGVSEAFYSSTYISAANTDEFIYWLYADLDHVIVVRKNISSYWGHYSGIIKRFWSSAIAITQVALTNGSSVVAQVNDASIFTPNQHYVLKDNAKIERVRITAIDTASTPNTLTIETLTKDYAAGAKIGEDPQPVINSAYNFPGTFYAVNKFDGWSSTRGQAGTMVGMHGGSSTSADPERRYGTTILFPFAAYMSTDAYQELRGELIEVYAIGGGNVASEDTVEIGPDSYRVFYLQGGGSWVAIKE